MGTAAAKQSPQRAQAAQQRRAGAQPAQQCGAKLERKRQKALGHARAHRLSHHGPFTEFDGHVGHHSFLPGFSGTALDGVRRICPLSFPARRGAFPKKGINRARAAYLWQGTHNYKSPRQKILSLHAGDLLNLVIFYNYLRFADVTGR